MPAGKSPIISLLLFTALSLFAKFSHSTTSGFHEAIGETRENTAWHTKARIIKINLKKRKLLLAHQDVPGLMPAMTMPFSVSDLASDSTKISDLRENDTIAIDFSKVKGDFSIHRIVKLNRSPITKSSANLNSEILWQHPLRDQHNSPVRLSDFRGKVLLVNFIYTHCPTVCPVQTANLAKLNYNLIDKELTGTHLISISLDPERDTPARLLKFASKFSSFEPHKKNNWSFLTGVPSTVKQVTNSLNAIAIKSSKNEFEHWSGMYLIDQSGNISATYHGDSFDPLLVMRDIEKLLKS